MIMKILQVGAITAPVLSLQVEILLDLLGKIIFVNLVSLVDTKSASLSMTHCGMVMDVVQTTAAATWLGCRGSTGPSHRKWVMTLRCVCVPIRTFPKRPTWAGGDLHPVTSTVESEPSMHSRHILNSIAVGTIRVWTSTSTSSIS